MLLVLLLAAVGGAAYELGWVDHYRTEWFGAAPDPVPEPEGLDLPAVVTASPVAEPAEAVPGGRKVRRALAAALADDDLGPHVVAGVAPAGGGAPVWSTGTDAAVPASTTKLLTGLAALDVLGPEHRFATRVVAGGGDRIVLVGGGDPLLARRGPAPGETAYPVPADVGTLAKATAQALRASGHTRVSLGYDDSLFTGPAVNPRWEADYVPDGVVSPITSLWVDEGRDTDGYGRVADPALEAARVFAKALGRNGITVVGAPAHGTAASTGEELARVESPPLREIVEHVELVSDNEGAEVLSRHVGLAVSGEGSAVAGARDTLATLDRLGVDLAGSVIYDGSGLSRHGRLTAATLLSTLQVAASPDRPDLAWLVSGLPVAGFSGSLEERYETAPRPGLGRVRAKTGTLTGVSGLAGLATDLDGTSMVFVLLADRIDPVDTLGARAALDRASAALGACHCAAR